VIFYAATSMRNEICGVIEPWLHGAIQAPGTRFVFPVTTIAFTLLPEQHQFVALDRP
jgi:hypothetical protein